MSENAAPDPKVLNWRGPLLAAAIFAVVFALLMLMARQNQSNISDMGSSLRQDPYGTSLLFDSYERAGYQVERSQDEDSLSDRDASRTTAFFIGGYPEDGWEMVDGKPQSKGNFRERLENFLAAGGRVVLVEPALELKSSSQGWDVQNQWPQAQHNSAPAWASPDARAMPADSERMYLGNDAPWLKTDVHWTALYSSTVESNELDNTGRRTPSPHVYMAMRRAGKGELVAASQQWFLLNEAIKTHPNPVLLDSLTAGRPSIWVDETLHGLHQEQGALWLVQRYRLQAALVLFWATLLAVLWSMSGDLIRRPPREAASEIVRNAEAAGMAGQRLLQRSIPPDQVAAECWEQFRRRSPHDAQAIASDPRWKQRLRAALAQLPLAGYRELNRLIAERRASARSVAHVESDKSYKNAVASGTTAKEV
jgi:hypothetical protein